MHFHYFFSQSMMNTSLNLLLFQPPPPKSTNLPFPQSQFKEQFDRGVGMLPFALSYVHYILIVLKIHISFMYTESKNKLQIVLAQPPNKTIQSPIVHELWPHLGHGRGVVQVLVFTGFHWSFSVIFFRVFVIFYSNYSYQNQPNSIISLAYCFPTYLNITNPKKKKKKIPQPSSQQKNQQSWSPIKNLLKKYGVIFERVGIIISIIKQMKIKSLLIATVIMYSATATLYSVSSNFTITYEKGYDQLAHATYQQTIYQKGWNYLHIYANPRKSLLQQHRGAGYLEGYVSYREIYSAYQNLVGGFLKSQQLSIRAQEYIQLQLEFIDQMVAKNPRDLYWQYAAAYVQQLRYMYRGYITRINVEKTLSMYIGFSQFYYLTNEGDLQDLIPAFHNSSTIQSHIQQSTQKKQSSQNLKKQPQPGNCNAYVKLMDNSLYLAHSTHNIYHFLLRIFKTYHFPTRDPRVGSQWFSFSSRPGDMISKDDFYVLSSGLYVMETSLSNMNTSNYADLSPRTVPCWLRATIAVNLARNGNEWVDYFLKFRSGTHNNQWVIVDSHQVSSLKEIVTFVEEGFSQFEVIDMTPTLLSQGYVGSYNVPKSEKISKKLGYKQYPYTYETEPRAGEYKKYNKLISNVQDMKKWLINNENTDPKIGLAPRYDLDEKNPSLFGLTDCKIITPETLRNNYIWAYSGPSMSNGRFQPFDWTNWPNSIHFGMPRKWNFTWEKFRMVEEQFLLGQQREETQKQLQEIQQVM